MDNVENVYSEEGLFHVSESEKKLRKENINKIKNNKDKIIQNILNFNEKVKKFVDDKNSKLEKDKQKVKLNFVNDGDKEYYEHKFNEFIQRIEKTRVSWFRKNISFKLFTVQGMSIFKYIILNLIAAIPMFGPIVAIILINTDKKIDTITSLDANFSGKFYLYYTAEADAKGFVYTFYFVYNVNMNPLKKEMEAESATIK